MSIIESNRNEKEPLTAIKPFLAEFLSKNNVEHDEITDNKNKIVGLDLLYKLSSSLSDEILNINDTFVDFNNQTIILSNDLNQNINSIDKLSNNIDILIEDVQTVDQIVNQVSSNKVVRFRGISTTDPKTGIVTLDGIKYKLKDFTKENNGDIFYYRDTQDITIDGKYYNQGIIYAYIYQQTSASSKKFVKIGYGFYNNLSSLIKDDFVADDAAIKITKIDGLSSLLSSLQDNITFLSTNLNTNLIDNLSNNIDNLSDELNNLSISINTATDNTNNLSIKLDDISADLKYYLLLSQISPETHLSNVINDKRYLVPSLSTLSVTLNDYSLTGHTHETTDIGNLPEQIDSIVSSKIPFVNIDQSLNYLNNNDNTTTQTYTYSFEPKIVYILKYDSDVNFDSVNIGSTSYNLTDTQSNGKCLGLFYYSGVTKTISPAPKSIETINGVWVSAPEIIDSNISNVYQSPGNGIFYIESSHNIIDFQETDETGQLIGSHPKEYWSNKWLNFANGGGAIKLDSNEGLTVGSDDFNDDYILPGYFCDCSDYEIVIQAYDESNDELGDNISQRVPSTNLLKSELDKLESKLTNEISKINERVDEIDDHLLNLENQLKQYDFSEPTPPEKPSLTATQGSEAYSPNIVLTWNEITSNYILSYDIYRGTNQNNMSLLKTLYQESNDNTITSYTDNVGNSQTRYYKIVAINKNSITNVSVSSEYSNIVNCTSKAAYTPLDMEYPMFTNTYITAFKKNNVLNQIDFKISWTLHPNDEVPDYYEIDYNLQLSGYYNNQIINRYYKDKATTYNTNYTFTILDVPPFEDITNNPLFTSYYLKAYKEDGSKTNNLSVGSYNWGDFNNVIIN